MRGIPQQRKDLIPVRLIHPGAVHPGFDLDIDLSGNLFGVKPIDKDEATSYGRTWSADKPGFLATVDCGYADGLPRAYQGHLQVGIGGRLYPQVGRVCMDQIVVDLGENPHGITPGDEAIIFGQGGMSATELADAVGTINYEVVCRPTGRTEREYIGGADAQ